MGGERRTICVAAFLVAAAIWMEALRSLWLFLGVLCPLIAVCFSMMHLSMQSLVTNVASTAVVGDNYYRNYYDDDDKNNNNHQDGYSDSDGHGHDDDGHDQQQQGSPRSIFSVLAALDVLQNAVSVSVPFYRTFLFRLLNSSGSRSTAVTGGVAMQGDPDPVAWVLTGAVHWTLAAGAMAYLLLGNSDGDHHQHSQSNTRHDRGPQKNKGR